MKRFCLAIAILAFWCVPAFAQPRIVTVGAPQSVLIQFLQSIGSIFESETRIEVKIVPVGAEPGEPVDALLLPARLAPPGSAEQRVVFEGEAVLVGSRADRARVRGLRDMKAAFRWIASARAFYVASSPSLGLRDLELELWARAGVNVRAPLTWYEQVEGDEAAVLRRAGRTGAYALVHRASWLAQDERSGLEIIAQGDPALRVPFVSVRRSASPEAAEWHAWLASEKGAAAIAGWRLNGVQVFAPAGANGQVPGRS